MNTERQQYKVLIVEDSEVRISAFLDRFMSVPRAAFHYAETAQEAIERLEEHGLSYFDLICLDHDLSEEANIGYKYGKGTGMEVAQWIADEYNEWDNTDPSPFIIIHSTNSIGAANMHSLLLSARINAMIRPFLWTKEVFEATIRIGEDE